MERQECDLEANPASLNFSSLSFTAHTRFYLKHQEKANFTLLL